ncbi:hypothetical protein D922_02268 [Enterococcus faecalis 06-MB-DW-09]|nr:hypothetical protein D922_02268 [Enterococcus faecalis 06-MB-DW-09]
MLICKKTRLRRRVASLVFIVIEKKAGYDTFYLNHCQFTLKITE